MNFNDVCQKLNKKENPSDWYQHLDGGGWCKKGTTIDKNAWIDPRSIVCGNAKISGRCMIWGGIIYGHAHVINSHIHQNPRIYGRTKVDNSFVFGNAKIYGNAQVLNGVQVRADAHIFNDAHVSGDTLIDDNAKVFGSARVFSEIEPYTKRGPFPFGLHKHFAINICDNAKIFDHAQVFGNVYGHAQIYGNSIVRGTVGGNAHIYENAIIDKRASIGGDAHVYGNAEITGNHFSKSPPYFKGSRDSIFNCAHGYITIKDKLISFGDNESYIRSILNDLDYSYQETIEYLGYIDQIINEGIHRPDGRDIIIEIKQGFNGW